MPIDSRNPIPVSAALTRRASQFGFPVKGGVVPKPVSVGMPKLSGIAQRVSATPIECPYCHEALEMFSGVFVRMVGCVDARRSTADANEPMLMEVAPPGTIMAACGDCEQSFFIPARGRSTDAD